MLRLCLLLLIAAAYAYGSRYLDLYTRCYQKYRRATYCRNWCIDYIRNHPHDGYGKTVAIANAFAAKGSAKALSLGKYNQDAIANALGQTATAGAITKKGNALSNALGVHGAHAVSKTHGGGHSIAHATSTKGHAHAHAFNYGSGHSTAYANGRRRRSAYPRYGYKACMGKYHDGDYCGYLVKKHADAYGGHKQAVSNAFSASGAAKALSLGHFGQDAISKSVGQTAMSGSISKYGNAISASHGKFGAKSVSKTHGGGHSLSQSHSKKGNSNSHSFNYGHGNSMALATGRKRRSLYGGYDGCMNKYHDKHYCGYIIKKHADAYGGKRQAVSNAFSASGAAKALSLGHFGQDAISKSVGQTAMSGSISKYGNAISASHGKFGAKSVSKTHGGGHSLSQSHSKKGNSNSHSFNYGHGNSMALATGRKRRSVYAGGYDGCMNKYHDKHYCGYIIKKHADAYGGHKQAVSNAFSASGAAKALSLGHFGQDAISKSVGQTAMSGSISKHGNAISASHGKFGAKSVSKTHGGGHSLSQSHSKKGNSHSHSFNYGHGNSMALATGRKRRSVYGGYDGCMDKYHDKHYCGYIIKKHADAYGGHKQAVSNAFSNSGAAKALSLGHFGQDAISKSVGQTAMSGSISKHGNAISASHGKFGAKSVSKTHGGGHSLSQSHSKKGNSHSHSFNYGHGNSMALATGRKRRSANGENLLKMWLYQ